MKFFYINNSQCTDCDRCSKLCPTGAIYVAQGKRYINYDKCTSCGTCLKQCTAGAITIETLEKVTIELERIELYKSRVKTLEHELLQARADARETERLLSDIVTNSPIAMFVVDRNNLILTANKMLVEVLAVDPLILAQMQGGLYGENLDTLLSQQTVRLLRMSTVDEQTQCQVIAVGDRNVAISVSMLADGVMLGFVRDLNDRMVVGEEIVARLKETIDRKMSMVQKIGFLLGEEVSVVVNNLNTVIKIIESAEGTDEK